MLLCSGDRLRHVRRCGRRRARSCNEWSKSAIILLNAVADCRRTCCVEFSWGPLPLPLSRLSRRRRPPISLLVFFVRILDDLRDRVLGHVHTLANFGRTLVYSPSGLSLTLAPLVRPLYTSSRVFTSLSSAPANNDLGPTSQASSIKRIPDFSLAISEGSSSAQYCPSRRPSRWPQLHSSAENVLYMEL